MIKMKLDIKNFMILLNKKTKKINLFKHFHLCLYELLCNKYILIYFNLYNRIFILKDKAIFYFILINEKNYLNFED